MADEMERASKDDRPENARGGKGSSAKGAHIMRIAAAAWRQRKAPSRIRAVVDQSGTVHTQPEGQALVLSDHWQRVFSVTVDRNAAESLARGHVPKLPSCDWRLTIQ